MPKYFDGVLMQNQTFSSEDFGTASAKFWSHWLYMGWSWWPTQTHPVTTSSQRYCLSLSVQSSKIVFHMHNNDRMSNYSPNTWLNNNIAITSKRRHVDVIMSKWRFDVIMTSLLHNVSAGYKQTPHSHSVYGIDIYTNIRI